MSFRVSVKQLDYLLLWQTQHPDRPHDSYILHYSSKYRHTRRGKHSAAQTQTADTLLYHDGQVFFLYLAIKTLHQANLPNSSRWISPHHKWLVSVFPCLAILNFSLFFWYLPCRKKIHACLEILNTHNVKIIRRTKGEAHSGYFSWLAKLHSRTAFFCGFKWVNQWFTNLQR